MDRCLHGIAWTWWEGPFPKGQCQILWMLRAITSAVMSSDTEMPAIHQEQLRRWSEFVVRKMDVRENLNLSAPNVFLQRGALIEDRPLVINVGGLAMDSSEWFSMYNPCFFNRTLTAVLGQGETQGWESWKSWKCDYLFSLLNHTPFVCGSCLHLLFLPTSLYSHSHLQDSVARKGSSSIAEKGWPAWWQMGDAVGKLGWDERLSGSSLSSPRPFTSPSECCSLENTPVRSSLVQLLAYYSWQHLKVWTSRGWVFLSSVGERTGLMVPLEFQLCGSRPLQTLWACGSTPLQTDFCVGKHHPVSVPFLPSFLDGNLEQGLDAVVQAWGTANYPQQWIPASQLLLADFSDKKPDRVLMLKHTVACYFVKSRSPKHCFW